MDYPTWIREQYAQGTPISEIALASLHKPIALSSISSELDLILKRVADKMEIEESAIYIVGSTRFGFSLRDGTLFDSHYSDLDLAIIHPSLYSQCEVAIGELTIGPRFPETDLPYVDSLEFRRIFDEISISNVNLFAYISAAVFKDKESLIATEAFKIKEFLGIIENKKEKKFLFSTKINKIPFNHAVNSNFPRFLSRVNESPSEKSSPYIIDINGFRKSFGTSSIRNSLLKSLDDAIQDLTGMVDVICNDPPLSAQVTRLM